MTDQEKFGVAGGVTALSSFALATATPGLGWLSWAWAFGGFIGAVCGTTYATYILCKHCKANKAADAAEPLSAGFAPRAPDGAIREVEARVIETAQGSTMEPKQITSNDKDKPYCKKEKDNEK